jgi:hypothetical protein
MLAPMFRAVRRLTALATAAVLAAALAGCAGLGQPAPYDFPGINGLVVPTPSPDPRDFVAEVDNPWLALGPGATRRYDVTRDGRSLGTIEAEVVAGTTLVAGLTATAVRTVTDLDGTSDDSDVTRFYAQDDDGNVWLVGADADGASWRAGEAGAEAGLAMPAGPRLGDGWRPYAVPGLPEAGITVEDQSSDLVQTREESGTAIRHVYEKDVGLVGVADLEAGWQAEPADPTG